MSQPQKFSPRAFVPLIRELVLRNLNDNVYLEEGTGAADRKSSPPAPRHCARQLTANRFSVDCAKPPSCQLDYSRPTSPFLHFAENAGASLAFE